eukprot:4150610-Pleurochrysis_carterae.AAC.1
MMHWNTIYKHMTKQKLDGNRSNETAARRDYSRMVSHRILAIIKKLKNFNQSRQHGAHDTQTINKSMANSLHSIGMLNPYLGSFQLNNNIKLLLSTNDSLSDIQPLIPPS